MKGKDTIINEMVANAADVMEAKAEYLELVASQFDSEGQEQKAAHWRKDIPDIMNAVALMRRASGCWA